MTFSTSKVIRAICKVLLVLLPVGVVVGYAYSNHSKFERGYGVLVGVVNKSVLGCMEERLGAIEWKLQVLAPFLVNVLNLEVLPKDIYAEIKFLEASNVQPAWGPALKRVSERLEDV